MAVEASGGDPVKQACCPLAAGTLPVSEGTSGGGGRGRWKRLAEIHRGGGSGGKESPSRVRSSSNVASGVAVVGLKV